jgi:cobalt/nickel transport system permease protein
MHMADALLSPAVGVGMLALSAAAIGLSVKKISSTSLSPAEASPDDKKIPMMGVMGAFVFAGQMINFSIPGTGSSGHIGGGILLAAILGPFPALITLASILLIQCLFFADGGLLAWGCNVFNMGVIPCLIVYPLIYRPLVRGGLNRKRIVSASIVSVVAGLQAGAFGVVLETLFSGITEIPFGAFVLLMQPIHLAIGLVEGIVTAAVLCYVYGAQPDILEAGAEPVPDAAQTLRKQSPWKLPLVFAALSLVIGAVLSLFASSYPDGLEWSLEKAAGTAELERSGPVYEAASSVLEKTAFLPDYAFPGGDDSNAAAGTAVSGIAGSIITLLLVCGIGFVIYALRRKTAAGAQS